MTVDWGAYRESLNVSAEDVSWADSDDLGQLSLSTFMLERTGVRRDLSFGTLRLLGDGVSGHAAPLDAVGTVLRNFQRLVLATGLAAEGFKSVQGRLPAGVVQKTRLLLDGVPTPGSMILHVVPAASPADEIVPSGQTEITPPEESQTVDRAVRDALGLLDAAREAGPDLDESRFLRELTEAGPRVATTLKDLADSLVAGDFETELTWRQPRKPRTRVTLTRAELVYVGQAIQSRQLEKEPVTLIGTVRTVSDLSPLRLDVAELGIVTVTTSNLTHDLITSLMVGMRIAVRADVTEETYPAGEPKLLYAAESVEILGEDRIS